MDDAISLLAYRISEKLILEADADYKTAEDIDQGYKDSNLYVT